MKSLASSPSAAPATAASNGSSPLNRRVGNVNELRGKPVKAPVIARIASSGTSRIALRGAAAKPKPVNTPSLRAETDGTTILSLAHPHEAASSSTAAGFGWAHAHAGDGLVAGAATSWGDEMMKERPPAPARAPAAAPAVEAALGSVRGIGDEFRRMDAQRETQAREREAAVDRDRAVAGGDPTFVRSSHAPRGYGDRDRSGGGYDRGWNADRGGGDGRTRSYDASTRDRDAPGSGYRGGGGGGGDRGAGYGGGGGGFARRDAGARRFDGDALPGGRTSAGGYDGLRPPAHHQRGPSEGGRERDDRPPPHGDVAADGHRGGWKAPDADRSRTQDWERLRAPAAAEDDGVRRWIEPGREADFPGRPRHGSVEHAPRDAYPRGRAVERGDDGAARATSSASVGKEASLRLVASRVVAADASPITTGTGTPLLKGATGVPPPLLSGEHLPPERLQELRADEAETQRRQAERERMLRMQEEAAEVARMKAEAERRDPRPAPVASSAPPAALRRDPPPARHPPPQHHDEQHDEGHDERRRAPLGFHPEYSASGRSSFGGPPPRRDDRGDRSERPRDDRGDRSRDERGERPVRSAPVQQRDRAASGDALPIAPPTVRIMSRPAANRGTPVLYNPKRGEFERVTEGAGIDHVDARMDGRDTEVRPATADDAVDADGEAYAVLKKPKYVRGGSKDKPDGAAATASTPDTTSKVADAPARISSGGGKRSGAASHTSGAVSAPNSAAPGAGASTPSPAAAAAGTPSGTGNVWAARKQQQAAAVAPPQASNDRRRPPQARDNDAVEGRGDARGQQPPQQRRGGARNSEQSEAVHEPVAPRKREEPTAEELAQQEAEREKQRIADEARRREEAERRKVEAEAARAVAKEARTAERAARGPRTKGVKYMQLPNGQIVDADRHAAALAAKKSTAAAAAAATAGEAAPVDDSKARTKQATVSVAAAPEPIFAVDAAHKSAPPAATSFAAAVTGVTVSSSAAAPTLASTTRATASAPAPALEQATPAPAPVEAPAPAPPLQQVVAASAPTTTQTPIVTVPTMTAGPGYLDPSYMAQAIAQMTPDAFQRGMTAGGVDPYQLLAVYSQVPQMPGWPMPNGMSHAPGMLAAPMHAFPAPGMMPGAMFPSFYAPGPMMDAGMTMSMGMPVSSPMGMAPHSSGSRVLEMPAAGGGTMALQLQGNVFVPPHLRPGASAPQPVSHAPPPSATMTASHAPQPLSAPVPHMMQHPAPLTAAHGHMMVPPPRGAAPPARGGGRGNGRGGMPPPGVPAHMHGAPPGMHPAGMVPPSSGGMPAGVGASLNASAPLWQPRMPGMSAQTNDPWAAPGVAHGSGGSTWGGMGFSGQRGGGWDGGATGVGGGFPSGMPQHHGMPAPHPVMGRHHAPGMPYSAPGHPFVAPVNAFTGHPVSSAVPQHMLPVTGSTPASPPSSSFLKPAPLVDKATAHTTASATGRAPPATSVAVAGPTPLSLGPSAAAATSASVSSILPAVEPGTTLSADDSADLDAAVMTGVAAVMDDDADVDDATAASLSAVMTANAALGDDAFNSSVLPSGPGATASTASPARGGAARGARRGAPRGGRGGAVGSPSATAPPRGPAPVSAPQQSPGRGGARGAHAAPPPRGGGRGGARSGRGGVAAVNA